MEYFETVNKRGDNKSVYKIDYYTDLFFSLSDEEFEMVKYLIDKGADIYKDKDYFLHKAAEKGYLKLVKLFVDQGAEINYLDNYALRMATINGHLDVVKYLIEKGADVHSLNNKVLLQIIENGHLEVVKYLLEKGDDISIIKNKKHDKINYDISEKLGVITNVCLCVFGTTFFFLFIWEFIIKNL